MQPSTETMIGSTRLAWTADHLTHVDQLQPDRLGFWDLEMRPKGRKTYIILGKNKLINNYKLPFLPVCLARSHAHASFVDKQESADFRKL